MPGNLINQTLSPLVKPMAPTGAAPSLMDVERWKFGIKDYLLKVKSRKDNAQLIYGLVLGQYSPAIRSQVEAHADWNQIDVASDVMGLLGTPSIIQQCMMSRQTQKNRIHSLFDAKRKPSRSMFNQERLPFTTTLRSSRTTCPQLNNLAARLVYRASESTPFSKTSQLTKTIQRMRRHNKQRILRKTYILQPVSL
jgi:hypothetical protein